MSLEHYPPVGFHFLVRINGFAESQDILFQSVSGLSSEIETEEFAEGGQLQYKHKLPVRAKFSNLVLKRGMVINSQLVAWLRKSTGSFEFEPKNMTISLLNQDHQALVTWNIVHAYPIKWQVDEFNSNESKLAVETIELVYSYYTII